MPAPSRHWPLAPFTAAPVPSDPGRYALIDLARGLAATCILFCHYRHFFYTPGSGDRPPDLPALLPAYGLFWPLYDFGQYAVQLFWLISGFVFAKVYAARPGTTGSFLLNRFARLYPLHLATLLAVAALQAVARFRFGGAFVHPVNDFKHFALHLVFASNWSRNSPTTFNGPVWSVSVEVLIYAVFWTALSVLFVRGVVVPLAVAAAFFVAAALGANDLVCSCGTYFFLGVAVYVLHDRWRASPGVQASTAAAMLTAGVGLLAGRVRMSFATPLVGGAVVLGLAALEQTRLPHHVRRWHWVGESTYGIYLCHFPLQLAVLLTLPLLGLGRTPMASPWALLAFVVLAVAVGRASFVVLERPAQRWLRTWGTKRGEAAPAIAAP